MKSTLPSETEEGEERAAGFVLFRKTSENQREYLLLRHVNAGHWAFPKGRLEPGENEFEAAVRELAEETSLDRLDPVCGFRETSSYSLTREGRQVSKTVAYFLAESLQGEVQLSSEHTAYQWLEFDEALSALTYAQSQRILRQAEAWAAASSRCE